MRQSLKEYTREVGKRWWAMLMGGVVAIVGVIDYFCEDFIIPIPTWGWFAMAVFFLFIAQFLAFHQVRKQRDELKKDLEFSNSEDAKLDRQKKQLEIEKLERDKPYGGKGAI
jgi:hypothetical protein